MRKVSFSDLPYLVKAAGFASLPRVESSCMRMSELDSASDPCRVADCTDVARGSAGRYSRSL
jgi:hypothetical protein